MNTNNEKSCQPKPGEYEDISIYELLEEDVVKLREYEELLKRKLSLKYPKLHDQLSNASWKFPNDYFELRQSFITLNFSYICEYDDDFINNDNL